MNIEEYSYIQYLLIYYTNTIHYITLEMTPIKKEPLTLVKNMQQ